MTDTLETERLLLRRFTDADLSGYHEIMGRPEVGRWFAREGGFTLEETEEWLDRFRRNWKDDGYGPYAVVVKRSGKLVGHCGLRANPQYGETDAMYALHPKFWRRGFITEAMEACLEDGFERSGLEKIICYTLPGNAASRRVMVKLGMKYVKTFEHAGLEHVLYELRKDVWKKDAAHRPKTVSFHRQPRMGSVD